MSKVAHNVVKVIFIVACSFGAGVAAHHFIGGVSANHKAFPVGLVIFGFLTFFYSETMLGRLIDFEHEHHHGAWLDDGCPRVSLWGPEDHRASYGAGKKFRRELIFNTPAWVRTEPSCMNWLTRYRVARLVSTGCFLTLFIMLIMAA